MSPLDSRAVKMYSLEQQIMLLHLGIQWMSLGLNRLLGAQEVEQLIYYLYQKAGRSIPGRSSLHALGKILNP